MKKEKKGFTLVELAIVITIIGLLVGGVLKGQELWENSRIMATGVQVKSLDTATKMFVSLYKNLPGDIPKPAEALNNCTAAPCNIGGDGDSWIGSKTVTTYGSNDEPNAFWAHLKASGLYVEIPDAGTGVVYVPIPMSENGFIVAHSGNYSGEAFYTNKPENRHWWYFIKGTSASQADDIPVNKFAVYDTKFDDGKPFTGDALINKGAGCGVSTGATSYDISNKTPCSWMISAGY